MRPHPFPGRPARALLVAAVLSTPAACAAPPPEPAPFVHPEVGTVYRYRDVVNVVMETDGIRMRYKDHLDRVAERVGLFLTTSPENPVQIDTVALMSLWPLEVGKEAVVEIRSGEQVYEYEFVVQRVEPVETGFGTFDSYIVQGVVSPKLVRDPALAQTVMTSWWYSPELNAVTRFRTTYLAGPGEGTVVGDRLVEIMDEEGYEAWRREQPAQGDTAPPAGGAPSSP